jgi:two-component system phosphate regulon response regulator PhoB
MASESMKPLILIAEDEPAQVEVLRYNLESEGFDTVIAGDGESALDAVDARAPDLVVLDWMLPAMSGIEVCQRLRARPEWVDLPIIMLTARGEEADRVRALDSGADDYVVKPFSPSEIVARVRAVLRRARPELSKPVLAYAGLELDLEAHRVRRDGAAVRLNRKEFDLLRTLAERPGRVFSREQLLDRVWGRDIHVEARTVDVSVRRLRKALNAEGRPDLIRTVRGAGYALDERKD